MNIVAGEPIRRRDEDVVEPGTGRRIAQVIQSWSLQAGSTVAVVAKDRVGRQLPVLGVRMSAEALKLALNRLAIGLTLG
jgi:hypothetical protein